MTYRTADESLENYQQLMGDKLGEIFHYIVQEWVQIKILWEQYENLFGKGKERVDLLNKCGGQFFFYVQQILYDTVLLRICKLVDSPEKKDASGKIKNKNLSIPWLEELLPEHPIQGQLCDLIKNLKEKTKHAQKIRNKKIGHNDFNTKTNKSKIENKYTREEITEIISIIYEIINLISENICESSIHDSVNRGAGTELTMLINLYLGQKQIEENRATRDWRNNPLRDLPDWLKN